MAKEKPVTCTVAEPMCEETAVRMWTFLIEATAKRENVKVIGTVRKVTGKEAV